MKSHRCHQMIIDSIEMKSIPQKNGQVRHTICNISKTYGFIWFFLLNNYKITKVIAGVKIWSLQIFFIPFHLNYIPQKNIKNLISVQQIPQ